MTKLPQVHCATKNFVSSGGANRTLFSGIVRGLNRSVQYDDSPANRRQKRCLFWEGQSANRTLNTDFMEPGQRRPAALSRHTTTVELRSKRRVANRRAIHLKFRAASV